MTRHLVTSALPYANGPIHFGQVIGAYLPADVYVRTLRMKGEEVAFICGTDEHGVAITIKADQEGVPYPEYVARWRAEIISTFEQLGIEFDIFSGTSICPWHAELSQEIFRNLDAEGFLLKRTTEQLFCGRDEMFLADRYVEGTCYECEHPRARGDECPSCGAWLDALRLIDPSCKLCGSAPEKRETTHWYLDLPGLRDAHIGEWFRGQEWKSNVSAFVRGMFDDLQPRPITRDMRWGVAVPEEVGGGESGKVLYVWFDAPIGYISFTREWAEKSGSPEAWKEYWHSSDTRLVHFIGKDNIPFHCLIFPSMLWGTKQGYTLPCAVPAMEFYNLQGRKFSTSDDWTIPLDEFFERYDRDVTRFYLLSSAPESADSEWRWEGFQRCANASLADTVGNLVTRVLRFVEKHFGGEIPPLAERHVRGLDTAILEGCGPVGDPADHVLAFRFRRACETLVANAAVGNVFVDRMKPWNLVKSDPDRAASVVNTCCEWIRWLARWMTPFMPEKAQRLWAMLGQPGDVATLGWPGLPQRGTWRALPCGQALGEVAPPFPKIDDAVIEAEIRALRGRAGEDTEAGPSGREEPA